MIKTKKYLKQKKKKKERRTLTFEEIFTKSKYQSIFHLMLRYSSTERKIKLHHLKYVLVKGYNTINKKGNVDFTTKNKKIKRDLEKFFQKDIDEETIEYFSMLYKIGEITKEEMDHILADNELREMVEYGILTEENKFNTEQNLYDYIAKMKKLGVIEPIKEKKGYPYFKITPLCLEKYHRFFMKYQIDKAPVDSLEELFQQIGNVLKKY